MNVKEARELLHRYNGEKDDAALVAIRRIDSCIRRAALSGTREYSCVCEFYLLRTLEKHYIDNGFTVSYDGYRTLTINWE